jgi:methylated-DNA-[protein]-cysteine S-methyltransferase
MTLYCSTFPTPFGAFTIAVDETGAVVASAFGDRQTLCMRTGQCHLLNDTVRTRAARGQVEAYCARKRTGFSLALAPHGTPFQQRVWAALRAIPFGETRSYGDLARALRSSPRAVGRANATNPVCLIVPCHRVIGTDGSLTGYAFGEQIKRRLLEHEGAL